MVSCQYGICLVSSAVCCEPCYEVGYRSRVYVVGLLLLDVFWVESLKVGIIIMGYHSGERDQSMGKIINDS